MKHLTLLSILFFAGFFASAQQTLTIPYQALVRDANGNPVTNQQIGARITLLAESITGNPIFEETHTATTNAFGQMDFRIGSVETTAFNNIDWSTGKIFIKLEVDINGGTAHQIIATHQLLAVPYAKYAEEAAGWKKNETGISFMDGNVGIGKTNPEMELDIDGNIKIDGSLNSFKGLFYNDSLNLTIGSTSGVRPRIYLHGINSLTHPGKIYMAAPENIVLMSTVGIGTNTPSSLLTVAGTHSGTSSDLLRLQAAGAALNTKTSIVWYEAGAKVGNISVTDEGSITRMSFGTFGYDNVLNIKGNSIGIGTINPGTYKLNVNGSLYATNMKTLSPDFSKIIEHKKNQTSISDNGDNLLEVIKMSDLNAFTENDSTVDLVKMNVFLLEKIDLLIQSVIKQQKETELLKSEIETLKNK